MGKKQLYFTQNDEKTNEMTLWIIYNIEDVIRIYFVRYFYTISLAKTLKKAKKQNIIVPLKRVMEDSINKLRGLRS